MFYVIASHQCILELWCHATNFSNDPRTRTQCHVCYSGCKMVTIPGQLILNIFPIFKNALGIWTCRKVGKCQRRTSIWTNLVVWKCWWTDVRPTKSAGRSECFTHEPLAQNYPKIFPNNMKTTDKHWINLLRFNEVSDQEPFLFGPRRDKTCLRGFPKKWDSNKHTQLQKLQ